MSKLDPKALKTAKLVALDYVVDLAVMTDLEPPNDLPAISGDIAEAAIRAYLAAQQGPEIKGLEWTSGPEKGRYAGTSVGVSYMVFQDKSGTWRATQYIPRPETLGGFGTEEAAKAACQLDYETRIRSALAPSVVAEPTQTSGSNNVPPGTPLNAPSIFGAPHKGEPDEVLEFIAAVKLLEDGGWKVVRPDVAKVLETLAAPPPMEGMVRETGWLIELKGKTPQWFQQVEDDNWTTDSLKALRFARKQDAEAYINSIGWTETFASEHEWSDPSPKYLARRAATPNHPEPGADHDRD